MNIYQMSADSFYDIDSPAFPYKWKKGVNMNIRTLEHCLEANFIASEPA